MSGFPTRDATSGTAEFGRPGSPRGYAASMRRPCLRAPFRIARVLILLLVVPLAGPRAFAWGNEGHRIIGTIATSSMDEAVLKEVRDLLGEMTIADACVWADEIRSDRRYDWVKPLHYINVPRNAERILLERDGEDGQQIVSAIVKYRDVLKDRSKPREERVEALKLVMHFVGDVHQPLHVSYKDDLGGNRLALTAFGRKSNLHRAWDTDLIQRRLKDTKGGWATMSADLRETIKPDQRRQWSASLEPIAWANESLATTRRIYAALPKGPGDIDDAYYREWMPTVNERLQAAGVRLALMLNEALGPGTKKSSSKGADSSDPAAVPEGGAGAPAAPSDATPAPAPSRAPPADSGSSRRNRGHSPRRRHRGCRSRHARTARPSHSR